MRPISAIIVFLSFCFSLHASPEINILGTIKTFDGKPIQGVTVTLVKQKQVTTTDASGVFKFPAATSISTPMLRPGQSLSLYGRTLALSLPEDNRVSLQLFDLKGVLVYSVFKGRLPQGDHRFNLPAKVFAQQVYLLRLGISAMEISYKLMATGSEINLSGNMNVARADNQSPVESQTAKSNMPLPQRSAIVDTIRMSHQNYNAEYFTFSSYVDTFDLVLAKKDWQWRFPIVCRVIPDDSTLPGFLEVKKWKPGGVPARNAWLDSVGRIALSVQYRDSLEATKAYRGQSLPDTFIYKPAVSYSTPTESQSMAQKLTTMPLTNTSLWFPTDPWLYDCLIGKNLGSGCTATTTLGKIECGRMEISGCITHELFGHGMDNEGGYFGNPPNPKFFEGKNDCQRYWAKGFPRTAASKPSEALVDSASYQSLGFFFVWLEEEKAPQLCYLLNQYCAKNKTWVWSTDWPIFAKRWGLKDKNTLWTEYKATYY